MIDPLTGLTDPAALAARRPDEQYGATPVPPAQPPVEDSGAFDLFDVAELILDFFVSLAS